MTHERLLDRQSFLNVRKKNRLFFNKLDRCQRIYVSSEYSYICSYYMASSASGQDEQDLALCLATRAVKMALSC